MIITVDVGEEHAWHFVTALQSIYTHAVKDVHPALHGDALEHSKHCKQDVVKIGDTKVWSSPVLSALSPTGT